jgi:23S rRNA pseudouridine1911/1915/1917 synthase
MTTKIIIKEAQAGLRADIVATEALPALSRAYIRTLFDSKHILVNQKLAKPGQKLRCDDMLTIDFNPDELQQIESIDLPVIYENADVLVINKPAGIISHSRGRYWYEPSVASFVREKTGQEGERSGIVHRLDRATSGVMICAKNSSSLSWLQKQFSGRNVKKNYIAIVGGHLKDPAAIIDMPIERNPKRPQTFRAGANGKTAQTEYRVIESYAKHDKLLLRPLTGRTHQLRVHLKQLGHPIVGDSLYGQEPFERLLLHAVSLEITLPDGEKHIFTTPEPPEFKEFGRIYG